MRPLEVVIILTANHWALTQCQEIFKTFYTNHLKIVQWGRYRYTPILQKRRIESQRGGVELTHAPTASREQHGLTQAIWLQGQNHLTTLCCLPSSSPGKADIIHLLLSQNTDTGRGAPKHCPGCCWASLLTYPGLSFPYCQITSSIYFIGSL